MIEDQETIEKWGIGGEKEFSSGWSAFTQDWFDNRTAHWIRHVLPHVVGKRVKWLEIGSHEGRSACWTVQHVLTHPGSMIFCVDVWKNPDVEQRFDKNLSGAIRSGKVRKFKGDGAKVVGAMTETFDVVYVDSDHQAKTALLEGLLAWRILKQGGFMIFDDYLLQPPKSDSNRKRKLGPKKGVDAFLDVLQHELKVVHKAYQVIVRKIV